MAADTESLLERLVSFRTVAGRPNLELVDWLSSHLDGLGIEHSVAPAGRPDAAGVVAVVGPSDAGGVLLAGHTDVVDVEGQDWSSDPFVLRRADGRLYGRGTADMKGFLAAALAVLPHAARAGLRRPLYLALSTDEELGCRGTPSMIDALDRLPARPSWCLVGEPTRMGVAVRHKGKAAARVRVRGKSCHSSAAPRGVNAVEYAARLITSVSDRGRELFLGGPADSGFSVPTPTISVGPVRGGMSLNVVPDECTFEVEARALPGQDPRALLREALRDVQRLEEEMRLAAPEAGIDVEPLASYPPLAPAEDGAAAELAARLAAGERALALDFGTEAGLYAERLGVPVVVCGPGSMAQGHGPDEYIEVEQLAWADRFLRRLVDWLAAAR